MEKLDEIDRKITRAMQGDFPLVEEPYKEIAAQVGIEEEELLRRLRRLKEQRLYDDPCEEPRRVRGGRRCARGGVRP